MIEIATSTHSAAFWKRVYDALTLTPSPRVFESLNVDLELLSSLSTPPHKGEPYGRKVLYQDSHLEIMLATWAVDAECAPHDHGSSFGYVWLPHGNFTEQKYILDGTLMASDSPTQYEVNSLVHVEPGHIHSFRVEGAALSLHFYSPPINQMKVYDAKTRTTFTVTNDCGAWLPQPANILHREYWD